MSEITSTDLTNEFDTMLEGNAVALAEMLRTPNWLPNLAPQLFQAEVSEHYGAPQKHTQSNCQRWGANPGSIRWNGAKVPVRVPRVRNLETNQEVPLQTYKVLHEAEPEDEQQLTRSVLLGLSQCDYGQTAEHLARVLGSVAPPPDASLLRKQPRPWRSL